MDHVPVICAHGGHTTTKRLRTYRWCACIGSCGKRTCTYCGALHFFVESPKDGNFRTCCMRGQMRVPDFPEPSPGIRELYRTKLGRAKSFRGNFRVYNNLLLGMATAVGNWSTGAIGSRAPSVLRINGQIRHIMNWNVPTSTCVGTTNKYTLQTTSAKAWRLAWPGIGK